MADELPFRDYLEIPQPLRARIVSRNYFTFLGESPAFGRFFEESYTAELQAERVAVISYGLWRRDFGGDHQPD